MGYELRNLNTQYFVLNTQYFVLSWVPSLALPLGEGTDSGPNNILHSILCTQYYTYSSANNRSIKILKSFLKLK